jgi:hypothetical protein
MAMSESFYYKKLVPASPLILFNGTKRIDFPIIGLEPGYLEVSNPVYVAEINATIKAGIGGVELVSKAEYDQFVKKKESLTSLPVIWREEVGRSVRVRKSVPPSPTLPASAQPVAAADRPPTPEEIAAARPVTEKRPI